METKEKVIGSKRSYKYNNFNIDVHAIDRKNTKCVSVNLGMWLTQEEGLQNAIQAISRRIRRNHNQVLETYFEGSIVRHLTSYDYPISTMSMKPGATSFVSIEFTLFGNFDWYDENWHFVVENYGKSMLDLITSCDGLIITATKKG